MKTFNGVKFAWTFRTYQQAVLDKSSAHLRDGHIHIVAAPGSGKTILGLELVRRLGKPALILAPSVTIRRQWGERFAEAFLPEGSREEEYVSEDLHTPQLLTCVTYQALHAAMQRLVLQADTDGEAFDAETAQDYTDFDLMQTVKQCGIATICLDEAHHLRREWQKALEQFLQLLGGSVRVIALTATPPYDSTPAEWDNYIRVCGEVDEEIFVPQLVAQNTLCPHQDYLYFNMPTESETETLRAHFDHARAAAQEILAGDLLRQALDAAEQSEETAQKDVQGMQSLRKAVAGNDVTMQDMQSALSFVLGNRDDFPPACTDALSVILARNGVLEKGKVCLLSTDKIDKMLLASAGKLESIRSILSSEATALGEDLRALILTDYIRREMLPIIGTAEPLTVMGAVPVFEAVRRAVGKHVPVALLSGTLVILPDAALDAAAAVAAQKGIDCRARSLGSVPYSEVQLSGSNKNKVSVITELFERGVLRVLIGTASLLGEGWDAPCINSLVLASYVGSFMLTNQMRGRAIRIDKKKKDKASNIWHLVTIDPPELAENGFGADFAVMQRRFISFMAPDYNTPWIESGTDRLCLPDCPITENEMQTINGRMLERSRDRATMVSLWTQALGDDPAPQVLDVCEIPQAAFSAKPASRYLLRWILCALLSVILLLIPIAFIKLLSAAAIVPTLVFLSKWRRLRKPEEYFRLSGKAILRALHERKAVNVPQQDVFVSAMPARNSVYAALRNAGQHDKMVFSQAMGTVYSAIDDPRYLLVGENGDLQDAHAVPAALDKKKEDAQAFADCMKPVFGKTKCVYVRGQKERRTLWRAREKAALNKASCKAQYKKIVVHSEAGKGAQ